MAQIPDEEKSAGREPKSGRILEHNEVLRVALTDIVQKIGEHSIERDDIQVLIVRKVEKQDIPVSTIYYAGQFVNEVNAALDKIQEYRVSLEELSCFADVNMKKCVSCTAKEYIIHCLLLNEMADYYGVVQFILNEIVREAGYGELISKKLLDGIIDKSNLSNRAVLMEKYTQKFLKDNRMPSEELLIELSARKYEGSESEARIYFDNDSLPDKNKVFVFDCMGYEDRKLESGKLRTIRKLMEMSKRNALQLLADDEMCIIGLISIDKKKQKVMDSMCNYIYFNGYMQWSVYIRGKEEICYKQGRYYINSSKGRDIYEGSVNEFKNRIGIKLSSDIVSKIENLVEILKDQRHGTTVIITDDEDEVVRLCGVGRGLPVDAENQIGFLTDDNHFDREKLLSITEIDGALFMNMQGKCTAFGVIVDGVAKVRGDTGRGARFNSIYNYIYHKSAERTMCQGSSESEKIYIALIFSEDGGVDIIDNLTISSR